MNLPTGTITFLFTDIEGSTHLWEQHPEPMRQAHARHAELITSCVQQHGGTFVRTRGEGDSTFSVFPTAPQALAAACAFQRALAAEPWPAETPIRVRAALHTGTANLREEDYNSIDVNRCARLRAIAHGGQTILSQTVYDLARERLPQEVTLQDLGQHRLKDLSTPEHIWQLCHPDLPADFPHLNSLTPAVTNLPIQLTSFIGREREMQEVKRLLQTARLLTLTGAGGCGKTRLALQVSADILEQYPHGVWLAELAPLSDSNLVVQAAATALGLREQPGKSLLQTLTGYLQSRNLLLLLDNCEHLLSDCARLVDTLLTACPGVKVLATSREALRVGGEQVYRVPSLLTPDPQQLPQEEKDLAGKVREYDAAHLFVERAGLHKPDFALTHHNAPTVAQLCHRLDGIPLALELAAARVRVLPVEEINARLGSRFRLLTGGSRSALPRQQTLRALIDWSYDLLNAQERILLARLSVFAGGWSLEAAEQVCAGGEIEDWEILDLLTSLLDKSLVIFEARQGKAARYRLLETIRQYGQERLEETGDTTRLRVQHRDYFLSLATEANLRLKSPDQAMWLERLEIEHDNLRAALQWSAADERSVQARLQLALKLCKFWDIRGYWREGHEQLLLALTYEKASEHKKERAWAIYWLAAFAKIMADYSQALSLCDEAMTLMQEVGDKDGVANIFGQRASLAYKQGDFAVARAFDERRLALSREMGNSFGVAHCLHSLGSIAHDQGDFDAARVYYHECLTMRREQGDTSGIASSLSNLGNLATDEGDYETARTYYIESAQMHRDVGNKRGLAIALQNRGLMEGTLKDYTTAQRLHLESLQILQQLGDRRSMAFSLQGLGIVSAKQGDYDTARAYLAQSLAIRRELGDKFGIATSLNNLGWVIQLQGDCDTARAYQKESLTIQRDLGHKHGIICSLINLAALAQAQAQPQQAVLLHAAADALRQTLGFPLPSSEREEYELDLAALREALGEEAFAATWEEGRAMTLEQAIEYALSF